MADSYTSRQSHPAHFSSVQVLNDRSLIAASPGRGVFHKSEQGNWNELSEGLPNEMAVNRLSRAHGISYACTSRGLYRLRSNRWQLTEVGLPCYQYKEEWGCSFAATQSGLHYNSSGKWKPSAHENSIVYDFLFTPQFLYIGLDRGISMYDRIADRWAVFELGFGIAALAASGQHLFGASERGDLVISNGRGGFNTIRFDGIYIYSVVSRQPDAYACTDRGLYRITNRNDRITLFSVKSGVPVTDIDWHGTELYMATLSRGVQMIQTEPWCPR